MTSRWRWLSVALALSVVFARTSRADEPIYAQARTPLSGYAFLGRDLQALQDDSFANPGLFWVEQGARLWQAGSSEQRACASCHGDATQSMRGVAARYPAFDGRAQQVINLEQKINQCRQQHQQTSPWVYESRELLSMTAYLSMQSRGMPVNVRIDGPARDSFARGRQAYERRRGQLDMSCVGCHVERAGSRLRGDVISQGQINGHPVYRLTWQTLGSTHRMFAWCDEAVRAEPYPLGSQAYVDLELFVKWLGRGLPVETPGVRR